jgi:hypothetical protein
VIFVPEWPKGEFVSFIGYFLLTKSLSCNVTALTGIPYYLKVFKYSDIISLIWKGLYYDKFQYHKLQEGNFRVPRRFCAVSNSTKVESLVSFRMGLWSIRTPFCVEKILPAQHASVRTLFSVREESGVLCKHGLGRQLAIVRMLGQHRSDAALIRKRVKRLMERR